jgi:outer membrane protein OmpA-like peptidoglycan-associated protein
MLQSTYNEIPGEFELEQEFDLEKPFERPDQNIRFQVISHYPRYGQSIAGLPASEREKIHRVASFVAHALRSGSESVRLIRVVGHADLDTPRRPTFEQQIGRSRAKEVLGALLDAIDRVDAGPERPVPPYSSRIAWDIQSAGATQLVVANPRSELDRSRNRRVEISVVPYSALPPASAGTSTTRVAFATSAALDVSAGAAIHDFLRRAPNDLLRYNDPLMGPDQPDRRICVSAAATKATQLCGSTSRSDRGEFRATDRLPLRLKQGGAATLERLGSPFLLARTIARRSPPRSGRVVAPGLHFVLPPRSLCRTFPTASISFCSTSLRHSNRWSIT